MKPLMLHGHERSITQIRYNREGDLLFSCAKDNQPNVWYSINGERLGSYTGHGGAVWCIDVDWETSKVLTGSADNTIRLWDCHTGKSMNELETKSAVRSCNFSYSGNLIMTSTDAAMGHPCTLMVYDIRDENQIRDNEPMMSIPLDSMAKITAAVWGPLEQTIITGHANGDLCQWDMRQKDLVNRTMDHAKAINDVQNSKDGTMIITASKDCTAKLFDAYTLECQKTFKTERPVNSAAISPILPHIVMGGGQDAMDVTTTSTRIGKFDARFYHLIFEEEFGRIKGHFGPINSVAYHPDGKGYSSGGEDGYIRLHNLDSQYFDFEFEY